MPILSLFGGGSAISGEGSGAVVQQQQQQQQGSRGVSSGGVVRRRSWRVHYTRPKKNKSFEYETSTGSAYENGRLLIPRWTHWCPHAIRPTGASRHGRVGQSDRELADLRCVKGGHVLIPMLQNGKNRGQQPPIIH
uniref:Uncharacterized protein n=1 Tax=Globodera rostochiensis TaxID=31243 RepID=A0A914H5H3_GLORO